MDVTFEGVFRENVRDNALWTLGVICKARYQELAGEADELSAEIEAFKDPAFWERFFAQQQELEGKAESGATIDELIAQAAGDGLLMKAWQGTRSDQLQQKLMKLIGLAALMNFAMVGDRRAVIGILRKSAAALRAREERLRADMPKDMPILAATADPFQMDAEFCELFVRALTHNRKDD